MRLRSHDWQCRRPQTATKGHKGPPSGWVHRPPQSARPEAGPPRASRFATRCRGRDDTSVERRCAEARPRWAPGASAPSPQAASAPGAQGCAARPADRRQGDDPHRAVALGTFQRIGLVHLAEQEISDRPSGLSLIPCSRLSQRSGNSPRNSSRIFANNAWKDSIFVVPVIILFPGYRQKLF